MSINCLNWIGRLFSPSQTHALPTPSTGGNEPIPLQPLPTRNSGSGGGMGPRQALSALPIITQPSPSVMSVGGNFERTPLTATTSKHQHPQHGELVINRRSKAEDSSSVLFDLQLTAAPAGLQKLIVCNSDDEHAGLSTVGTSDVFLPLEMQGKGVFAPLAAAMARVGCELGVQRVVIDNVASPQMDSICQSLGMTPAGRGAYEMDPKKLLDAALARSANKGWS